MALLRVSLFPLPNMVYFPVINKPLNIFEPRYLEMVEQAVSNDELIGLCMGLREEEPESVSIEHESLHYVKNICGVGVPQILERRENGELTILIKPKMKVEILRSTMTSFGYNIADAREIIDFNSVMPENFLVYQQLKGHFTLWAKNYFKSEAEIKHLIDAVDDPRMLVAMCCEFILVSSMAKHQVLELDDVNVQVQVLFDYILA